MIWEYTYGEYKFVVDTLLDTALHLYLLCIHMHVSFIYLAICEWYYKQSMYIYVCICYAMIHV